jgi:hypothetical protein
MSHPRRRVEPFDLAKALGAAPRGLRIGGDLDPIALAELGTELIQRLRSSVGRPSLCNATEYCRVPLSPEDVAALEKIIGQIVASTGTKPSVGQLASVIVRNYLSGLESKSPR